jgi:hypothetical protein
VSDFYLVPIHGDPARAAGLLALKGIQNVNYREDSVEARLRAANAEHAEERVRAALSGEALEVRRVRQE